MIETFSAEEYPQGSDSWKLLKVGIPSASNFADIMAAGEGKMRSLCLRKLAGEIVSGVPAEDYKNSAMSRGNAVEEELRHLYAMLENVEPDTSISFVKHMFPFGVIGCSPDALIGDDGGLELKSEGPHILIETLKADRVPSQHMLQIQGCMLVTGRKWWGVGVGYPGMPMFRARVRRDESAIARLRVGLEAFYQDLNELVAWLRAYGKG